MRIQYENISKEIENSKFSYSDYKVDSPGFSKIAASIYNLHVNYKEHIIYVKNELGHQNLGRVEVQLDKRLPEFKISNTNHFVNLFLRKKNILKVTCKNHSFKKFLEQKLIELNLEKIAKESLFEPEIYNVFERNAMKIITTYHLQFDNKTAPIQPLVNLYKSLIDY
ncbi:MAG: hypothetical protein WCY89_08350 [Flavobacteriaceae bacterium]